MWPGNSVIQSEHLIKQGKIFTNIISYSRGGGGIILYDNSHHNFIHAISRDDSQQSARCKAASTHFSLMYRS